MASFGLGLVGVSAFVSFVLIPHGVIGASPGVEVAGHHFFDWLPALIAFAGVAGAALGLVDALNDERSSLGRIGRVLAVLNVCLALVAFFFWVFVIAKINDVG